MWRSSVTRQLEASDIAYDNDTYDRRTCDMLDGGRMLATHPARRSSACLQARLFCDCGQNPPAVGGRCRRCYHSRWRSERHFGGNRERVLALDGSACRVCGLGPRVIVHHRRTGQNGPDVLATLCRACHAAVHRRFQPSGWWPELLVRLWEEQHPGWTRQLSLAVAGAQTLLARAA
mgnify:CR=1 FL=1